MPGARFAGGGPAAQPCGLPRQAAGGTERGDVPDVLGDGNFIPAESDSLFTAVAERFEILSPA
jgi:hypothetical protein